MYKSVIQSGTVHVFVINNPISILYLITNLFNDVDEIWIECGNCPALDDNLEEIIAFLGVSFSGLIRILDVENIFGVNNLNLISKYYYYRKLMILVNKYTDTFDVGTIICSTTSCFRLAKVRSCMVFDHGTGDYLRSALSLFFERFKFKLLSRNVFTKKNSYFSLLPLNHREQVRITSAFEDIASYVGIPLNNCNQLIVLVDPKISINQQLSRIHMIKDIENANIYLKFHHFHWKRQLDEYSSILSTWEDKLQLNVFKGKMEWLPVEAICLDKSSKVILVGFDSSAVWHMKYYSPKRLKVLMTEKEIRELFRSSGGSLDRLTKELSFSPYMS